MRTKHEHRFDLQLGADGHGQLYGNFEGYVRLCNCGEFAPDYTAWLKQRAAFKLAEARRIVALADGDD